MRASLRILIDLQGAQNSSKNRGIGRYSLALTSGIARNAEKHHIFILLNGLFSSSIEEVKASLADVIPDDHFLVFNTLGSVAESRQENTWRRESAEILREFLIAEFDPDALLVTSMVEGADDDSVTSIKLLDTSFVTAAIIYDLIPLISPDEHLHNDYAKLWYHRKLDNLCRADYLLAISESAKNEACRYLSIDPSRIESISSAASTGFSSAAKTPSAIIKRIGISRKYLMHAGAFEKRKNFDGLIRAFAALPKIVRAEYQLVLVCGTNASGRNALLGLALEAGLRSEDLVVFDHVTDEVLVALYTACHLFVYPSYHEGFGLPPLEAMSCGAPAIGSRSSSIPEVIGRDDALFDPSSDADISQLILKALTDGAFYESLRSHAPIQSAKFSWDKTAQRALRGIEQLVVRNDSMQPRDANRPINIRRQFMNSLAKIAIQYAPANFELLELVKCITQNDRVISRLRRQQLR